VNKQDPRYEKLQGLLRELRKQQGVNQQELADHIGKPQSYVSKYESGERNVDLIELIDVIKALGLKPDASLVNLVQCLDS
jgi:transcriptional regulator with XRE-family HTH domain